MQKQILFQKERDLGEILNDTFSFIRSDGKALFGLVFKIAGPALLVMIAAYIYYSQTTFSFLNDPMFMPQESLPQDGFIPAMLVMVLAAMVFYGFLYGTVLYYIQSYIKNNGAVDKQQVQNDVRNNFWPLLGVVALSGIIVFLGLFLCVLPGVYLGVVLFQVFAVYVFQKETVTGAIAASFKLIKDEWWMTFATIVVLYLLYYILVLLINIPQYLYIFAKGFLNSAEVSADPSSLFDWGTIAISSIGLALQYVLFTFVVIGSTFIYFSLNEKKNFTGTYESIDSIGRDA